MLALRLLLCWAFWLSLFARGEKDCELLQTSLTYRQDEAPSDLSGVVGGGLSFFALVCSLCDSSPS